MDIGIAIPTNRTLLTGPALRAAVAEIGQSGASAVWVNDHLAAFPVGSEHYPYSASNRIDWDPRQPQYEALTIAAFVAAASDTLRIGTSVLVLPQRHPLVVAKAVTTLATLAGGRFVLGVGAGWSRREMTMLGWDPTTRGARLDEEIVIMNALWSGRPMPRLSYYDIPDDVIFEPTLPEEHLPKVLIGGNSAASRARVLRLGDGWLPVVGDNPDQLRAATSGMRVLRNSCPRDLWYSVKFSMSIPDISQAVQATTNAAAAGWDELTFEFARWDLEQVCAVIAACQRSLSTTRAR